MLDIGCGNGDPIGRHLLANHFDVTGIDTSATLIGIAERRFPTATWLVGDMRELSIDRSFHGLVAWHSLFHLTPNDQRAMFDRFRSHALPRATLLFTSGPELGESYGHWEGEPLYHASLGPHEYRQLLDQSGFDLVAYQELDAGAGEATVWLAREANQS